MDRRILLGIDNQVSPATQLALRTASEFMESAAPPFRLMLLAVIPGPYATTPSLGMYVGHELPLSTSLEQRSRAEDALRRARVELEKRGIEEDQIEVLIRIGFPAEEIVKAARELHVNFIIVGSRGNSFSQKLRRLIIGSISRRVLQLAPCPVMIASLPQTARPSDLVTWYQKSITLYLQEHTNAFTVFTPQQAAQMFVPPNKKSAGRKEIAAAKLALEQLTSSGLFCRHQVEGELRYVND
jgi:nucleotide-binding universal stress UspA family protein